MIANLSEIPGAFHLPRPNWEVIRRWVDGHVAEPDRAQAWASIVDQWLDTLNEALGNEYCILEGENVVLFAPDDHPDADELLHFAELSLQAIVAGLGGVACEEWLGPLVILLFADGETYSLYASPFNPEDEEIRSGGMCLKQGYVHIALRPYSLDGLRTVLLHEITHACLSHLDLPGWLEEGVSQLAEDAEIPSWFGFRLDVERVKELRGYWQNRGLDAFWWGGGFYSLDECQGHCYSLALILFRLIASDHRRQIPEFLRHAKAADAGDSAAREFLGRGVAQLAAEFLGPGAWDPVPPNAPTFCQRGVMYFTRKNHPLAIADFTEAIRLDPTFAEAHAHRGWAHAQAGQYPQAVADYERAIQLNAYDAHTHNNLAWLLATCPEEKYRNGERAVEHAARTLELFGGEAPWYCMGTLAAAHAEAGDFEEARAWARESLRLAPEEERAGCKERLKLYKEERPYREARRS